MSGDRTKVYPVLLAGGSGTRLWPVSRERHPKQLVKFFGDDSLIQSTVKRLIPVMETDHLRVVCGREHFHEIAQQLESIGIPAGGKMISEPCGRNTAPAILLGMLYILQQEEDAILGVFPSDHVIGNAESFHKKLRSAVNLADMDYIVTFGITPHYPETGYGYIEGTGQLPEKAHAVKRFVEKPDMETARYYLESGNYFWNSGMFVFKASVMMAELEIHHPQLLGKMKQLDLNADVVSRASYEQVPNISIDYAVMEKTDKGAVLPSDIGWSDIGSWKSLYDFLPKDEDGNVIDGDAVLLDTQNCLIMGSERLIATSSIRDVVVVDTPDAVFVSDMEHSRDVKSIVAALQEQGRREVHTHAAGRQPWGTFTVLDVMDEFKVAKLVVHSGATLKVEADTAMARQLHVLKGMANTTVDGQHTRLQPGGSVYVAAEQTVAMENPGKEPLIIIEVALKVL